MTSIVIIYLLDIPRHTLIVCAESPTKGSLSNGGEAVVDNWRARRSEGKIMQNLTRRRPAFFSRYLLTIVCWTAGAVSIGAQAPTGGTPVLSSSDPRALTALSAAVKALTGDASVTDVTITGTVARISGADNESGQATLIATIQGDSRAEFDFASGNRTEVRNHSALPPSGRSFPAGASPAPAVAQTIGEWTDSGGSHLMAPHNVLTDGRWFCPIFPIVTFTTSQAYLIAYVGPETQFGESVLHLTVTMSLPNGPSNYMALMQHLSQIEIYLDSTTQLPVLFSFTVHPDDDASIDVPVLIRLSDYRDVNGVQVPFHVERYRNQILDLDLHYTTVSLNTGVGTAPFQIQ